MNSVKSIIAIAFLGIALTSCSSSTHGTSTPIDSTNLNGTAPAIYNKGDNPADDTNKTNVGDTGTKANNVHNTPAK